MAKKKYTYGPESYESDDLPTWEQVVASHSDAFWKEYEWRMARAKRILAAARKTKRQPKEPKPAPVVIIVKQR